MSPEKTWQIPRIPLTGEKCSGHSEDTRQCFLVASEGGLCAGRLPGEARAITLNRNDCTNKEKGGLQETCLGPKPVQLMRLHREK